MPLDPFFDERLRVHRKYLFDQALGHDARAAGDARAVLAHARAAVPAGGAPSEATAGDSRRRPRRSARALAPAPVTAAPRWRGTAASCSTVGTPAPEVRTVEHRVDVAGHPAVRVRIYYPDVVGDAPVPAVLAFFGGAFRIGGIDYPTTDAAYRRRAVDAHVAIAAVDYALAPEHRYPVQVEQALRGARVAVRARGGARRGSRAASASLGMSAGGNIAAALDAREPRPRELPAPAAGARGSRRRPHRRPPRPARDEGPRHPSPSRHARAALGGAHLPVEPRRTRSSRMRRRCARRRTRACRRR